MEDKNSLNLTPVQAIKVILFDEENKVTVRFPEMNLAYNRVWTRNETLKRLAETDTITIEPQGVRKNYLKIRLKDDDYYNYAYLPTIHEKIEELLKELNYNFLKKGLIKMFEESEEVIEEKKEIEEMTTVHEAIHDYNIADREFKEKMEKLKKHHKTDEDVLEAIIRKNFNIGDETPVSIGGETVSILFRNKIEYNIFKSLENTGLKYEVSYWKDYKMLLTIYLEPIE